MKRKIRYGRLKRKLRYRTDLTYFKILRFLAWIYCILTYPLLKGEHNPIDNFLDRRFK